MVLKLSIHILASPWQQQSDLVLRVTQIAHFSLRIHSKQLSLVTFCYTTAGIGARFWKHGQTDGGRTDGRTDRRGSLNSYLDIRCLIKHIFWLALIHRSVST